MISAPIQKNNEFDKGGNNGGTHHDVIFDQPPVRDVHNFREYAQNKKRGAKVSYVVGFYHFIQL